MSEQKVGPKGAGLEGGNMYYFAHPYTVRDKTGRHLAIGQEANFRLCCIRAAQLLRRGFLLYAPICHTHPIHVASPEFLASEEYALWLQLDNAIIAGTAWAGIILAPGWEQSSGCRAERAIFEKRGLKVLLYSNCLRLPITYTAEDERCR